MTVQEAKDILSQNLYKYNSAWKDKFDIFIGDFVKETFESELPFPNCYIINVASVDKGERPEEDDWDEWFVSKTDGHFGSAFTVENVA